MKIRSWAPGLLLIIGGVALIALAALQFFNANVLPSTEEAALDFPTVVHSTAAPPSATPAFGFVVPSSSATAEATDGPSDMPAADSTSVPEETPDASLTSTPAATRAPTKPPVGSLTSPVRVVIPRINVDSLVVPMTYTLVSEQNGLLSSVWNVPNSAVGHAVNSANPGENGNMVLSGHNNLYAMVFRKLYTLQPGDQVTVYNAVGQGFVYSVTQSYIVPERDASPEQRAANATVLLPTADSRVTLTSCWPETSNTHRAIVIGMLVGPLQ